MKGTKDEIVEKYRRQKVHTAAYMPRGMVDDLSDAIDGGLMTNPMTGGKVVSRNEAYRLGVYLMLRDHSSLDIDAEGYDIGAEEKDGA